MTTSGSVAVDDLEQLVERAGDADDLELRLGIDQSHHALPEQVVVVSDDDPHGHGQRLPRAPSRGVVEDEAERRPLAGRGRRSRRGAPAPPTSPAPSGQAGRGW